MPRPGRDVLPLEELRDPLDAKAYRLGAETGPNSVFSMADYDYPDRHLLRSFCTAPAIPWTAFDGIRADRSPLRLTDAEAAQVAADFAQLTSRPPSDAAGRTPRVSEAQRCVSRIMASRCPDVCAPVGGQPCPGATFLLLAAVAGDVEMARRCVDLGADPNRMSFLADPDAAAGQMQHGYSPMFAAVLAGQLRVMALLHGVGGSVHVYDRWGRSPLRAAAAMGNAEVVEWLRAVGAPRGVGASVPEGGALAFPIAALRTAADGVCACRSGRGRGRCGCVDDMFERWAGDRLRACWYAGTDLSAIAARAAGGGRQRHYA